MHVLFYLKTKKTNANGRAPIYCRITVTGDPGKPKEFSTGVFIKRKQWSNENKEVCKCVVSDVYNKRLQFIKVRLHAIHLDLELKDLSVSAEIIRSLYLGKPEVKDIRFTEAYANWLEYVYTRKRKNKKPLTSGTLRLYRIRQELLFDFLQENGYQNLMMSKVNEAFTDSFREWVIDYSENYANKQIQYLKVFLKWARKRDYIKENPLSDVTLSWTYKEPEWLSDEEIKRLHLSRLPMSESLTLTRDILLFQVYTGMAFCDAMANAWRIQSGFIYYHRQKTGALAIVPYLKATKHLLSKYGGKFPSISLTSYNEHLKELAVRFGIQIRLTSHVGRKTAGCWYLNNGCSMEVVSRILGHTDIRQTQKIYAVISEKRIGWEVARFTQKTDSLTGLPAFGDSTPQEEKDNNGTQSAKAKPDPSGNIFFGYGF